MTSITAPLLEIAVLVLGMLILMIEAFAGKIDKRVLAYAAITGLAIVLLASFFVAPFPSPPHATGFWSFYTADRLAIFFKQFALVTTIFVVIIQVRSTSSALAIPLVTSDCAAMAQGTDSVLMT
jgi:NADH-quinone oxidoreductase subunit N